MSTTAAWSWPWPLPFLARWSLTFALLFCFSFGVAAVVGVDAAERVVDAFVLRWWRRLNGPDSPAVGRRLSLRGSKIQVSGAADAAHRAAEYFEEAVRVGASTMGKTNPEVTQWIINWGLALHEARDYRRAFELFEEVLAIRRATLGTDDPIVADWLQSYALTGFVVGPPEFEYARVKQMLEECVAIRRAKLKSPNEPLASALADLAAVELTFGNVKGEAALAEAWPRAQALGKEAADLYEAVLGADNPKTRKAREDWS